MMDVIWWLLRAAGALLVMGLGLVGLMIFLHDGVALRDRRALWIGVALMLPVIVVGVYLEVANA
jgi:hypothetical protein